MNITASVLVAMAQLVISIVVIIVNNKTTQTKLVESTSHLTEKITSIERSMEELRKNDIKVIEMQGDIRVICEKLKFLEKEIES